MGSTMTAPDAPAGTGARPPAGAPALAPGAIDAVRRAVADAVGVQRGLEALAPEIAEAAAICWTARGVPKLGPPSAVSSFTYAPSCPIERIAPCTRSFL